MAFKYRIPAAASTRAQRMMGKLQGERRLHYIAYADDVILLAYSEAELQAATNILEALFTKFKLKICTQKTKTLILNWPAGAEADYPATIVKIKGAEIENVRTFTYLGSKLNFVEYRTGKTEVNYRVNLPRAKFTQLKSLFTNRYVPISTRVHFYNAIIRARLTYACGTWCLLESERDQIARYRDQIATCYSKHVRLMLECPKTWVFGHSALISVKNVKI